MPSDRQDRQRSLLAECPMFDGEGRCEASQWALPGDPARVLTGKYRVPNASSSNRWSKAMSLLSLCLGFFICDLRKAEELEWIKLSRIPVIP